MSAKASRAQIEELVRELLCKHLEAPVRGDAPLELPSLSLISFTEELEQQFAFVVAARELVPENFATLDRIVAFVERLL